MRLLVLASVTVAVLFGSASPRASGPVGIYAIIDRVVFEPGEQAPERLQVWGAFALVDGGLNRPVTTSSPVRGYLYFTMPALAPGLVTPADRITIRREWNDLKTVAGTGDAVGFGQWIYTGRFEDPNAGGRTTFFQNLRDETTGGIRSVPADLAVRAAGEALPAPVTYQTNAGVVKLAAAGSHAGIVKQLRAALGR